MSQPVNPFQEANPHSLIAEMKNLISANENIVKENKEKFNGILEEADFLLGKHDEYYKRFAEVFESMTSFEFNRKLDSCTDETEFFRFLALGMNTIVDELREKAIHKNLIHTLFEGLEIPNTMVLLTDWEGRIKLANNGMNGLPNFNDDTLKGQFVNDIFKDFSLIDEKIKSNGSVQDIPVFTCWKGYEIPSTLTVCIAANKGKIHGLIYLIKLPDIVFKKLK